MRVRFVDWGATYQEEKESWDAKWNELNSEGQLLLRADVEAVEQKMADLCGVKYAVGVNSGSDALLLALQASGVGEGDEVITVSHTFIATIQAIEKVGAIPVFVDVGDDEQMDIEELKNSVTDKTKAIIPVHLTGKMADMKEIMVFADIHDLVVIEDAAQAIGAKSEVGVAGGIGDFGCFSFYPFKILGCPGDGGLITTNNQEYYEKLLQLRNHGNASQTGMEVGAKGRIKDGWNSRLDNVWAGILNVRFDKLPDLLARREYLAKLYDEGLKDIPEVALPTQQEGRVYQEYVVQVENRAGLVQYLNDHEIEVLPNITQIMAGLKPNHTAWQPDLDLPKTTHFTETNLRLPIWPTLTDAQVKYVIKKIKDFYAN